MPRIAPKRLLSVLVAAAAGVLVALPAAASATVTCSGDEQPVAGSNQNQIERSLLCLVNVHRSNHGVAPLQLDSRLQLAARWHSNDMNVRGFFSHFTPAPNSTSPDDRAAAAGYPFPGIGENIAMNTTGTAWSLFLQWLHSPGHDQNMLSRQYHGTGLGVDPGCWCLGSDLGGVMGTNDFALGPANSGYTGLDLEVAPFPFADGGAAPAAGLSLKTSSSRHCKKRHHHRKRHRCTKRTHRRR